MRKPNFRDYWGIGKTPSLQIRILKSVVLYGKQSIKSASDILDSNKSDVYNAIQILKRRNFLEHFDSDSDRHNSRNPEKFYKITKKGLEALLYVNNLSPTEFWKVAISLYLSTKEQIYNSHFMDHYNRFENNFIGFSVRRHPLPSWFFDDILREWFEDNNNEVVSTNNFCLFTPLPQVVIECLAFNGPMNLKQLVENTGAKEEDIVEVLNRYSVKPNDSFKFNLQSHDETNIGKKVYDSFSSHILIDAGNTKTQTTYELSIFGILLALALIRYYHIGMDKIPTSISSRSIENRYNLNLFYKDKKMEEYYDKIAYSYKEKLPLIFAKWSSLKIHLGSLLYDNFDFLIYEIARSNIRYTSVWFGGNKEFYEEFRSIAQNAHAYEVLYSIYAIGKEMIQRYHQYKDRIFPVDSKIREIGEELSVTHVLSTLEERNTNKSQYFEVSRNSIKRIEDIFLEEVSFLFYLNLNTTKFSHVSNKLSWKLDLKDLDFQDHEPNKLLYMIDDMDERRQFSSPKGCLMAILSKDKDIKRWFSKQVEDILSYRSQKSEKMSQFSAQISKPQVKNRKQETRVQRSNMEPPQSKTFYEEHDITKICSGIQLPYDYQAI